MNEIYFELGIGTRLRRLLERLSTDIDKIYTEKMPDFKASYFYVFYAVSKRKELPISDIAALTGFSHSAISQTVKKLVGLGLIGLSTKNDARQKLVSLTVKGEEMMLMLSPLWQVVETSIKQAIDESGHDLIGAITGLEKALDEQSFYDRIEKNMPAASQGQDYEIVAFDQEYKQAFYDLNAHWLKAFFVVEPIDEKVLSNPEDMILAEGGEILFAVQNGRAIGTVAMKHEGGGVFELTKLAVDPAVQKGGIGRKLCLEVMTRFKARGGKKLFLDTSTILVDAIRLYERLNFVAMQRPEVAPYGRADHYMEWIEPK